MDTQTNELNNNNVVVSESVPDVTSTDSGIVADIAVTDDGSLKPADVNPVEFNTIYNVGETIPVETSGTSVFDGTIRDNDGDIIGADTPALETEQTNDLGESN